MICDAHIHVGQFYDIYTSPKQLVGFLDNVEINCFAASSTSICEGDYDKVLNEMCQLVKLSGTRIAPVLWIIPNMFKDGGLSAFIKSGLPWRCLKIHPQLHPYEWELEGDNMKMLLKLARTKKMPILIHTGEFDFCHAGLYSQLAKNNPDVLFILAHGRPIEETVNVIKECENVYTDTAFMPIDNIVKLCKSGLADRILWGTDYPIPKYFYRRKNMKSYYDSLVSSLKKNTNAPDFDKITNTNFNKLFQ